MLHHLTIKKLGQIALYGAVFVVGSGLYFQHKIQNGLEQSEYYQNSAKLLRASKPSVYLLGEPIKVGRLNLGDPENNFCDGYKAQFEVPVKGPKTKGTLYLWASRSEPGKNWIVDRLELGLKNDPTRRLLVYKQEKTEDRVEV